MTLGIGGNDVLGVMALANTVYKGNTHKTKCQWTLYFRSGSMVFVREWLTSETIAG